MRAHITPTLALGLLLTAIACAQVADAQVAKPPDRSEWLSDYELLKSELERSYSHLAWVASPESGMDLPALEDHAKQSLQTAETVDQAKATVLAFVAGFHDGHFESAPLPEPSGAPIEPPPPTGMADANTACAAYGYEARTSVVFSLPFESLLGFTLYSDGLIEPFRSGVFEADGMRLGIIRIPRFRAREYPALCRQLWSTLKLKGERIDSNAIARGIDSIWLESLGLRLRRFRAEHVAALIVDIGGNGGGNDLGDWAVRAFTDKPIRSPRLLMASGSVAIPYFDEQIQILQSALREGQNSKITEQALQQAIEMFDRRKQLASTADCSMSWVWQERRRWGSQGCTRLVESGYASGTLDFAEPDTFEPRAARALYWSSIADPVRGSWMGPVFVITDHGTGSSAEGFAASMHDSGIARTIGMRTWGDGCGFMDAGQPLLLPHLQLAFSIPNCVRLRADGTDEVAAVVPDIEISPSPGESTRARANRLLKSIFMVLRQ